MTRLRGIAERTARWHSVRPVEVFSYSRNCRAVMARQVAMYLCRRMSNASYPQIGRVFKRDHTTIIHGVRATAARIGADPWFAANIENLRLKIEGELGDGLTPDKSRFGTDC